MVAGNKSHKALIFLFLLFTASLAFADSTAWLVGTQCGATSSATNCESTYASDNKYAYIVDIDLADNGVYQYHYDNNVSSDATIDSFGVIFHDAQSSGSVSLYLGIGGTGGFTHMTAMNPVENNTTIIPTWSGCTPAYVNSDTFAVYFWGTFIGDASDLSVDQFQVKIFYTLPSTPSPLDSCRVDSTAASTYSIKWYMSAQAADSTIMTYRIGSGYPSYVQGSRKANPYSQSGGNGSYGETFTDTKPCTVYVSIWDKTNGASPETSGVCHALKVFTAATEETTVVATPSGFQGMAKSRTIPRNIINRPIVQEQLITKPDSLRMVSRDEQQRLWNNYAEDKADLEAKINQLEYEIEQLKRGGH
jgi:hypothetical protein